MAQRQPAPSTPLPKSFLRSADQADIDPILFAKPFLVQGIRDAQQRLRDAFGSDATFDLFAWFDPEGGEPHLYMLVNTTLPGGEAMQRLDQFDQWWIHQPPELQTELIIDFHVR